MVDNLQWDEDDFITTPSQNLDSYQWNAPLIIPTQPPTGIAAPPQERTPLIRKANSFHPSTKKRGYESIGGRKTKARTKPPRKIRPLEPTQKAQEIVASKPQYTPGRSTFGQTVSESRFPTKVVLISQPLQIQAVQFDRYASWYWDAFRTPRLLLCGMGVWYPLARVLRLLDLLHVSFSVVENPMVADGG